MERQRMRTTVVSLCAVLGVACHRERAPEPAPEESETSAPDRLEATEQLPEAETAFGLPLPKGMRLVRHFNDSAYFTGAIEVAALLEHVQKHLSSGTAQLVGHGAEFARAQVRGDEQRRSFRIEVTPVTNGTELHITDITPAPGVTGLNEAESWKRAGRNPDGTPIDQNQAY